jgi:hypothetical protein
LRKKMKIFNSTQKNSIIVKSDDGKIEIFFFS